MTGAFATGFDKMRWLGPWTSLRARARANRTPLQPREHLAVVLEVGQRVRRPLLSGGRVERVGRPVI